MYIRVNKDYSYDLCSETISMKGCYPQLDDRPIRPLSVHMEQHGQETYLTYQLAEGSVRIGLKEQGDRIEIATEMEGVQQGLMSFSPMGQALVENTQGGYRQGKGMADDTFAFAITEYPSLVSHGLTCLWNQNGALALWANDYTNYDAEFRFFNNRQTTLSGVWLLEGTIPGQLPVLCICQENSLEQALRRCADEIAAAHRARAFRMPPQVWCSWYYNYQNFNEQLLQEYLEAFRQLDSHIGVVQIDAGYCVSLGDWLEPNERWKDGLHTAARRIREAGYMPGIWIGPLMVGNRSRLFRHHPDWLLRELDGSFVTALRCYQENRLWGYRDEEYYVLDVSHPEALSYLRRVFLTLKSWGFEYFKTDFLLWGMRASHEVRRAQPGKTSVQYYRMLLDVIRDCIGEESFWLGCIAPFFPSIGRCDAMRIGGDVGACWKEGEFGPHNMIRQILGCNYFNQKFWINDPDAMMLRNFHTELTDHEVYATALLQGISGGVVCTSDPLHELSSERRRLFDFLRPGQGRKPKAPLLTTKGAPPCLVHELDEDICLIYLMNPEDQSMRYRYPLEQLTGRSEAYLYAWQSGEETGPTNQLDVVLSAHEGCLFYACASRRSLAGAEDVWHPEWKEVV